MKINQNIVANLISNIFDLNINGMTIIRITPFGV